METNKTLSERYEEYRKRIKKRQEEHRRRMEERLTKLAANGYTHSHRKHPEPTRVYSYREHPYMKHAIEKKAEETIERGDS